MKLMIKLSEEARFKNLHPNYNLCCDCPDDWTIAFEEGFNTAIGLAQARLNTHAEQLLDRNINGIDYAMAAAALSCIGEQEVEDETK